MQADHAEDPEQVAFAIGNDQKPMEFLSTNGTWSTLVEAAWFPSHDAASQAAMKLPGGTGHPVAMIPPAGTGFETRPDWHPETPEPEREGP